MNPKRSRKLWLSIGITLVLLALVWIVSTAVAQEPDGRSPLSPAGGSYANTFTYQGRLLEDGQPVSGTYDFIVTIWDSSIPMANQVATCLTTTTESILIEDGIFTLYLVPDQPMNEVFSGQERWIEIEVSPAGANTYTTLGRQPIAPTPYAWGLRSGAIISGDTSSLTGFGNAILNIDNTRPLWGGGNTASLYTRASTGSAIRAQSGGIAVYGESTWTYAIRGDAITGTAGYFTTGEGYGVYAETDGEDHWDHAGYFRANMGYGVYGVSTENYGVRGEGYFGVRGDGVGTGVSGYSTNHTGVRGNSTNGYGVHGDSTDDYGVYGTSDNDAGVYGYSGSMYGYGVVGVQIGYNKSDLGGFWEPGGFFGGRNGVVGITKETGGYGVYGWDKSTSGGWAGRFVSSNGNGVYISAPAGKTGLNVASGTKNAVVRTDEGSRLLYTEESTEVWFSDYGFGQLEDGLATVSIDPLFAQTVNLEKPFHVFVQVYGDAEVYVSNRIPTQFEVHLRDGDPNVEFSYRIVAKRLGYEEDRLERAPWADNDPNLYPEKQAILNAQQESRQP
jgi:hypothetical protein